MRMFHEKGVGCTQRDWAMLEAIQDHAAANGYAPTVRELSDAVGCRSVGVAWKSLRRLEEGGYIRRGSRPRDIEVLRLPRHMSVCPTCGRRSV